MERSFLDFKIKEGGKVYSTKDKENFLHAVESLKKYRRSELIDDEGKNLLEKLYTDLLPEEYILKKCLKENTTYLVGRKGTGKSTIFLRIEQELRKKDGVLPCYVDVKTVYESSQAEFMNSSYLEEYLEPQLLKKYLIERNFLQNVLQQLIKEIEIECDNFFEKIKSSIVGTKNDLVLLKLKGLKNKIENNEHLKEIEIPIIKKISAKEYSANKYNQESSKSASLRGNTTGVSASLKAGLLASHASEDQLENSFSSIFLQVFQIKNFITEVREVLKEVKIKHVVILLDDFSEVEDDSIRSFVDVVLAPLNNWSEEFIKFKIAAYPGRIYYGKIDPGKVDVINLDFYNLYSEFDRQKMEDGASNFTRRLIDQRVKYFTGKKVEDFFEVSKASIDDIYELLFQVSMNVPRIIGYVLSYCYQSRIIYDKKISRQDIESASLKYYEDKIEPFFHKTTYSLLSIDEKMDTLQLKELLNCFVEKLLENKKKITSGDLSGESYLKNEAYSSHFNLHVDLEKFLNTLELNYFISKYTEMSDRDGHNVSVFCVNYGLAQKHNLLWGKPKGTSYRKYFIQRPFAFNNLISDFFSKVQKIYCSTCKQTFNQEHLPLLEFSKFKCNRCDGKVVVESLTDDIKLELGRIEEGHLLTTAEIDIIMELSSHDRPLIAKEIAEEVDMSSHSVASKNKLLDLKKGFIKRNMNVSPYSYELTDKAKKIYKNKFDE